jgi:hypothetical protein
MNDPGKITSSFSPRKQSSNNHQKYKKMIDANILRESKIIKIRIIRLRCGAVAPAQPAAEPAAQRGLRSRENASENAPAPLRLLDSFPTRDLRSPPHVISPHARPAGRRTTALVFFIVHWIVAKQTGLVVRGGLAVWFATGLRL